MAPLAGPLAFPLGSGFSFVPGGSAGLQAISQSGAAHTDMLIDPVTLDYVRAPDGSWTETADARTLMMIALELELGASPFDPQDGTTIAARRRDGDPVTPDEVEAEALRVGLQQQREGLIANFSAAARDGEGNVLRDSAGRLVVALHWRDLSSGAPVDLMIQG